jgi:hypothetical protein
VAIARFLVRETSVAESYSSAAVLGRQLDSYHRFDAASRGSEPGQLDELVGFEPQEAAIVGMPAALEVGFEEERGV